ncbi:MAG: HAD family hydrolase [Planctomycetota bacterium]|nr:HAD family hydrolase [Planctomycetota bacterium]
MHVLLFDIDGTLINTRGSGLTALKTAFAEVFARPAPARIDAAGRTDRGIARDLFLGHTIEDTSDNWRDFETAYLRHLATQLPLREGSLLPGVVDLLQQLTNRDDVAVGLLTGNTPAGARLKLEHFEIHHYFSFGGFGDRHPERNGVARDALAAAQGHLRQPIAPEQVWVIGDTPLDIGCARHIGANAVAVATGQHALEDLARETPDLLLEDLGQAAALLERLNGPFRFLV